MNLQKRHKHVANKVPKNCTYVYAHITLSHNKIDLEEQTSYFCTLCKYTSFNYEYVYRISACIYEVRLEVRY